MERRDLILAVRSRRGRIVRFGVGVVPRGQSGRKEYGGELVPGPWAFTFQACAVIDNHGGSRAERLRKLEDGTERDVADGDTVVIDGDTYRVSVSHKFGDTRLDLERVA